MKNAMRTALITAFIGITLTVSSGIATATNAIIGYYPDQRTCMRTGEKMFGPWHGQFWCDPMENGTWRLRHGSAEP
ncbi:hypothetical protein [Nocardia paucivorans]|uniref:hypothetical protein n=1 Tax=Nocardia paucivorans TaxID=114259 RepID=UPI0012F7765A|nr:hypothetical protein [Nocardia paucivorans]